MSQSADETTTPSLPGALPVAPEAQRADVDTMAVLPDGPTLQAAPSSMSLDGELPRLGATPTPSAPPESRPSSTPAQDAAAPLSDTPLELPTLPTLPTAAPVITGPEGIPAPDAHRSAPAAAAAGEKAKGDEPPSEHPMAHLMPKKTAPSEASQRAAEIRAAKKAKARKIKIGVAVGSLVVVGVVGPPVGRWLADAVNEAGNTSTEEPAP